MADTETTTTEPAADDAPVAEEPAPEETVEEPAPEPTPTSQLSLEERFNALVAKLGGMLGQSVED